MLSLDLCNGQTNLGVVLNKKEEEKKKGGEKIGPCNCNCVLFCHCPPLYVIIYCHHLSSTQGEPLASLDEAEPSERDEGPSAPMASPTLPRKDKSQGLDQNEALKR